MTVEGPSLGNNILDSPESVRHDRPWLPKGFAFLSGFHEEARKRRVLLPVQAVIDDSGIGSQGPAFVFAGFLAEAEAWAEFSEEWQRCLSSNPRIGYFKMREAASKGGEFWGFSDDSRDQKLLSLAKVIRKYVSSAYWCVTDLSAFAETFAVGFWKPFSEPYFWPFHMTIMGIAAGLVEEGASERCEVIFDEHLIFGSRAKAWYPLVRTIAHPDFQPVLPVDPLFRDDKEFLPLQAADMAAWLFRRSLDQAADQPFGWLVEREFMDIPVSSGSQVVDRGRMERILLESHRTYGNYEQFLEQYGHLFPG